MAYKAPISREEKKLKETVQTMQALTRNEFKGDHVTGPQIEQARDFSAKYLPEMEQMLDSMRTMREGYNSLEKQFSKAAEKAPDWADKAIIYGGTGVAQVFGVIGSVGSIFSDNVASPKEVDVWYSPAFQGHAQVLIDLIRNRKIQPLLWQGFFYRRINAR